MNRRNFLRSMLGVAAATALPSEVWPFRKIFVMPGPTIWPIGIATINSVTMDYIFMYHDLIADLVYGPNLFGISRSKYPGRLTAMSGVAIEQQFAEAERKIDASLARLVQK